MLCKWQGWKTWVEFEYNLTRHLRRAHQNLAKICLKLKHTLTCLAICREGRRAVLPEQLFLGEVHLSRYRASLKITWFQIGRHFCRGPCRIPEMSWQTHPSHSTLGTSTKMCLTWGVHVKPLIWLTPILFVGSPYLLVHNGKEWEFWGWDWLEIWKSYSYPISYSYDDLKVPNLNTDVWMSRPSFHCPAACFSYRSYSSYNAFLLCLRPKPLKNYLNFCLWSPFFILSLRLWYLMKGW